jgi:FkbM family methyltransferase
VAEAQNIRYDVETVATMHRVLRADSCCIDVGAHRGTILQEMVRLAPQGAHHAFEPLPALAKELRQQFGGVCIHEVAVSDYAGSSSFVYVENAPTYSGLRPRVYDNLEPVLKPLTVEVVKLDDVVPPEHQIAFMKLDIEGGEFHALRGAVGLIGRCRPIIVFEASIKSTGQYGVTPEEIYRFITEQLGYQLSTMRRWLAAEAPYKRAEFCANWYRGPEFYFIAYPGTGTG